MMMTMKRIVVAALVAAVLLIASSFAAAAGEKGNDDVWYMELIVSNLDGLPGDDHTGRIVLEVHRDWAPLGAARWREMLDADFFTSLRFFRVVKGFVAQGGIHVKGGDEAAKWRERKLKDEPVKIGNLKGTLSFATSGPDTRTTQFFINFADNTNLDAMNFSPFAKVIKGMDIVERIYSGDGEKPNQQTIQEKGNKYLKTKFPKLSYIKSAKLLENNADL